MPSASVSTNGETSFSKSANILSESSKSEYATLAQDYTQVDGSMFFIPRSGNPSVNTGYVSQQISGADGRFTTNPIVTVSMEAIRAYFSLELIFGISLPAAFTIRTYNGGTLVNEFPIEADEISQRTVIIRDFDDFEVMEIEFTKTETPNNRIVLNSFSLSNVANSP